MLPIRLLLVLLVLAVVGCQPPKSVKDTLYGAQLTAENAVADTAKRSTGTIWQDFPSTMSAEDKCIIYEKRVKALVDQMTSIDKNLTAILYYYRVSSMNPFDSTPEPPKE